jgi:hypothetical protein
MEDRYLFSSALYEKPLESGEPGYDKVFITGRVERDESKKRVAVHIEDGMPTHASDPTALTDLNGRLGRSLDIPTTDDLKKPEWRARNVSSISAGCMIWVVPKICNRRLLVLKRDENAPSYPGRYANPGGRCDRDPMTTAAEECAQEICAIHRNRALLAWVDDPALRESLRSVKMEQIRGKRTELESIGVDVGLVLGREPWWMKDARLPPDEPFYRDVVVYNRGRGPYCTPSKRRSPTCRSNGPTRG